MANIFKKIEAERLRIEKDLIKKEDTDNDYAMLLRKKNLFILIDEARKKYTWLHNSELASKVDYFINNGYSYKALAKTFSTTVPSARSIISRASKLFEKSIDDRIWREAFGEIISFSDRDLSEKFDFGRELFMLELRSKLPKASEEKNINLLNCKRELAFLSYFTLRKFSDNFNTLSIKNLAYIMWVLEENKQSQESSILKNYFKNEIDLENLIQILEEVSS